MSSGRTERIIGTIKRFVGRVVAKTGEQCDSAVYYVVFGYKRRSMKGLRFPFELAYEVKSRFFSSNIGRSYLASKNVRETELLVLLASCAARILDQA